MAQLLVTVSAVAACVNVVLHPALAFFQKSLKDIQRLLPAMVVVELTAVVELLTGFQLFPSSQLGLVDTQVPVWVGGAGLAVGDGEIRVQDIPNRRDNLVDGSYPAHPSPVFDQPFPVVREGHAAAFVKAGVVGGHDHRDSWV